MHQLDLERHHGQATVGDHDARKAIGHVAHDPQADQTAPVLAEEGDVLQTARRAAATHARHLVEKLFHPLDVLQVPILRELDGLVRAPHADQVGSDHPKPAPDEDRDHLPVQVRPTRFAVHQQDHLAVARALVDVGHAQSVEVNEAGTVREVSEPGRISARRAHERQTVRSVPDLGSADLDAGRQVRRQATTRGGTLGSPCEKHDGREHCRRDDPYSRLCSHAGLQLVPPAGLEPAAPGLGISGRTSTHGLSLSRDVIHDVSQTASFRLRAHNSRHRLSQLRSCASRYVTVLSG